MKTCSGGQRPNGFLNGEVGLKIAAYLLQALWGCCSWHVVTVPSPLTCFPVPLFSFLSFFPPPQTPTTLAPFHHQSVNSFKEDVLLSQRASSYRVSHSCPPFRVFFDNTMMDHLRMDLNATSHGRKHQHPFFCGRTVYVNLYLHVSCSFLPPFPPFPLPHTPPGFRQTATPVSCLIYQASADKCKHLTEEPPHLRSLCGCSHFLFPL